MTANRPDLEPQDGRGPRCPQCGCGDVHPHPATTNGGWVEMHCARCGVLFLIPEGEAC